MLKVAIVDNVALNCKNCTQFLVVSGTSSFQYDFLVLLVEKCIKRSSCFICIHKWKLLKKLLFRKVREKYYCHPNWESHNVLMTVINRSAQYGCPWHLDLTLNKNIYSYSIYDRISSQYISMKILITITLNNFFINLLRSPKSRHFSDNRWHLNILVNDCN